MPSIGRLARRPASSEENLALQDLVCVAVSFESRHGPGLKRPVRCNTVAHDVPATFTWPTGPHITGA